jgi:hypothetical protein
MLGAVSEHSNDSIALIGLGGSTILHNLPVNLPPRTFHPRSRLESVFFFLSDQRGGVA